MIPTVATHVPLMLSASTTSPFHDITTLSFGQQMAEALALTDNRGDEAAAAARDFFRPRFDEQAARAAIEPTPLLYATHRLYPVLCYEIYDDRGMTIRENAPPEQLNDIFHYSVVPYAFALYESGLISRDPARAMIVAVAEAIKRWNIPAYVAACFADIDGVYRRNLDLQPRQYAVSGLLLTDAERCELARLPLEATLESLRWLVGFEQKTRFAVGRRESDALIRRFDELSAEPLNPEARAKRLDRARRESMRHDIRSYT